MFNAPLFWAHQAWNDDIRKLRQLEKELEVIKKRVWDCQKMPEDVRKAFFDHCEQRYCNDVYVEYYLDGEGSDQVDEWLLSQGAVKDTVCLIKHWW